MSAAQTPAVATAIKPSAIIIDMSNEYSISALPAPSRHRRKNFPRQRILLIGSHTQGNRTPRKLANRLAVVFCAKIVKRQVCRSHTLPTHISLCTTCGRILWRSSHSAEEKGTQRAGDHNSAASQRLVQSRNKVANSRCRRASLTSADEWLSERIVTLGPLAVGNHLR